MTLAVDEKSGAVYAGTLNGELFKGVLNGGSLVFTDITSALPGSPASILSAAVIGTDALTVVGGGGYIADSLDGGSTFVRRTSGTTSALHAVVGGLYRTLVAGGSYIAERSLLGDNSFRRVANQNGLTISGTAVGAAFTKERDLNFFAVVVSDGSIIFARDFSPYT
jgi:hypothetical protein